MEGDRLSLRWTFAIVVATLVMLLPIVANAAVSRYVDVPDSNVFVHDIEWMADAGITRGCNPPSNDMFCPDAFVTRGQMAAFMHRFADIVVLDDEALSVTHDMIVDGAVDSAKTWDEPGIAVNVTAQQTFMADPSFGKVESISITPPAPGYVIADMNGSVCIDHTNGSEDFLSFGFTDTEFSFSEPGENVVVIPAAYPTSRPCQPISQRVVYEVDGAAPFTTHLYGQQLSGTSPATTMFVDTILTLTYYPTAYGTIDLTH
jgi:hypothetical protein